MNKTLLAALTPAERHLVAETEPAALALLDEDETSALHTRVLRARNKAQGVYRRGASGKVAAKGGRGKANPQNTHARTKAEAFEEALGRVSQRLAALARQSARELRDERLAAAAAAKAGGVSGAKAPAKAQGTHRRAEAHGRPQPALAGEREEAGRQPGGQRTLAVQARRPLKTDTSGIGPGRHEPQSPRTAVVDGPDHRESPCRCVSRSPTWTCSVTCRRAFSTR